MRAASLPPHLHFQTVSTGKVSVHFHQGLEAMAREAVTLATEILTAHEERYGRRVGRVHVVLVDDRDDPNGFATPLPFPLVTIRVVAPAGDDDFGNHEGWLRLVLAHSSPTSSTWTRRAGSSASAGTCSAGLPTSSPTLSPCPG
ncbi:MAG: hypothetical protein A2V74_00720 [Acidobacteria bacterium RBG_16_70_10]|nr:MAG: hypothetical protein A2V74_00720 [Acidobacteria bacterium RBG_16_70_10]